MSTKEFIMKYSVKSNDIINSYLERDVDTEPFVLRKAATKVKEDYTFYTDGTVRSYSGVEETPGVAGYAWVRDSSSEDRHFHSWATNGLDINQVELQAIFSAVRSVRTRANVRIVTDSKVAYEVLTNNVKTNYLSRMTDDEVKQLTGENKAIASVMKYRDMILDEIHNNRNIKGFEIEWVRAHTMDKHANKKIWTNHAHEHDKLFNNIIGNRLADLKAHESINFSLRRLADIYLSSKLDVKIYDDTPSMLDYKSLIKQAHYVRMITLDYMAKKGVEEFPKDKVNAMFDDNGEMYSKLIEASSVWRQMGSASSKEEKFAIRERFNNIVGKQDTLNLMVDGERISGYNSSLKEVPKVSWEEYNNIQVKSTENIVSNKSSDAKPKESAVNKFQGRFGRFAMSTLNQNYLDEVSKNNNNEKSLGS